MIFCDYYLPGFKSGGGMWTVVNLVDRFKDKYDFFIVTRNHDGKADRKPYADVTTGEWNTVGSAQVFYLTWKNLTVGFFATLLREIKPDIVFLNSVFSKPSINFLRTRKRREFSDLPVIVSPCGELNPATLKLKAAKKGLFLKYAKVMGLYRGVLWRASFDLDADEIRAAIGKDVDVLCAPDLPPKSILPDFDVSDKPAKVPGSVRFVFVSRLVRKKNLHFLIERLSRFDRGEIILDVVGPIEDKEYWKECEAAANGLPENVRLNVVGPLPYPETFAAALAAVRPSVPRRQASCARSRRPRAARSRRSPRSGPAAAAARVRGRPAHNIAAPGRGCACRRGAREARGSARRRRARSYWHMRARSRRNK